ncbi:MAG: hypothetical protein QOF29_1328 [bacterium]|jgi:hypothetical protein
MHEQQRDTPGAPSGPFGYGVCGGCGAAVQRRLLTDGHVCDPRRYAAHQTSRLHWRRAGFDDALRSWLESPAGRFAQFYARRLVHRGPEARPGEA